MTARERILAIRLMEKQEKNPDYMKQIGIQVNMADTPMQAGEVKK